MMKYSWWFFMVIAFAKANSLQAQSSQVKIEKEERIDQTNVPAPIIATIADLAKDRNVKYYKETDGDRVSFEGKFKKDGNRYSAEFNVTGILEDVEVEVEKKSLDENLRTAIASRLDSIASRWRIEKIQEQYLPKSSISQLNQNIDERTFDNLELIVAFKTDGKIYRKELLFNSKGSLKLSRDVKRIAYDFLLF
ncbi:hypothetical protein [Nonlabens sp. YIK11]|uniref:hypothetical protein n=1 Tax=Nonlabens sp. YIK11 TaxID=1453349 RepID=UPI0012E277E5|nr:hypothetical protein [Nonlabens sp. YIK11]